MKTYYIVESRTSYGNTEWSAHAGLMARLGYFYILNMIIPATSAHSADDCERQLRVHLAARNVKPRVVRVVKI